MGMHAPVETVVRLKDETVICLQWRWDTDVTAITSKLTIRLHPYSLLFGPPGNESKCNYVKQSLFQRQTLSSLTVTISQKRSHDRSVGGRILSSAVVFDAQACYPAQEQENQNKFPLPTLLFCLGLCLFQCGSRAWAVLFIPAVEILPPRPFGFSPLPSKSLDPEASVVPVCNGWSPVKVETFRETQEKREHTGWKMEGRGGKKQRIQLH